jgi:uncharacterized protein HemX
MELAMLEGVSKQSTADNTDQDTPVVEKENFFEKHKTKIIVGVGLLAVIGIGYAAYSNSQTNEEVNGTLEGVRGKLKNHKKKQRRSK